MELLEKYLDGPFSSIRVDLSRRIRNPRGKLVPDPVSFDIAKGKGRVRVLRAIPDKEGKVRVMAIGDYWSQAALKPLHHKMFQILKRIPQDMTFNQGAFVARLRNKGAIVPGGKFTLHSVDLSKATDR